MTTELAPPTPELSADFLRAALPLHVQSAFALAASIEATQPGTDVDVEIGLDQGVPAISLHVILHDHRTCSATVGVIEPPHRLGTRVRAAIAAVQKGS